MKLIYLGQELDTEQEHELFSTNEFGFKVVIEKSYNFIVEVYYNCTEVHHKYEPIFGERDKIAFESDIHKTGFNTFISDCDTVTIELATKLYDNFYYGSKEIF